LDSFWNISEDHHGWNTASMEGKKLNKYLRRYSPGEYSLSFFRQLDYQIPKKAGNRVTWHWRWIGLAKGDLKVKVK
jgi:hypothetical protein